MTNISTLEKSDQQEESLVEQAAHSKDMTVRDLANVFFKRCRSRRTQYKISIPTGI